MATVIDRVDRLEEALANFVTRVGLEFNQVYNSQRRTEAELREFKDEMRAYKDENGGEEPPGVRAQAVVRGRRGMATGAGHPDQTDRIPSIRVVAEAIRTDLRGFGNPVGLRPGRNRSDSSRPALDKDEPGLLERRGLAASVSV